MELRYRREATVGALLIMSAVAFIGMMMWLRGKPLISRGHRVNVNFTDVMGLKVGDPIRTSGVRVGRVKEITLLAPGEVRVVLDVRSGPGPRVDAVARMQSQDFFGARYIEYNPGRAERALPDDTVISGIKAQDINEMAQGLSDRTRALIDTANAVTQMVSRELRVTLANTQVLLRTLNTGATGTSEQLVGALEELRQSLHRVDNLLAENAPMATQAMTGLRNTAVRADTLSRVMAHATAQLDSILSKVNNGSGPVPRLLNDSTVLRDFLQTNTALRDLLLDFRANPGRYIRLRLF